MSKESIDGWKITPTMTKEQHKFLMQVWKQVVPVGKDREQVKKSLAMIEEIEAILMLIPISDNEQPAAASNGEKPAQPPARKRK